MEEDSRGKKVNRGSHQTPSSLHPRSSSLLTAAVLLNPHSPLSFAPLPLNQPLPSPSSFFAMCKHAMCEHGSEKPAVPSFTRTVQTYGLALTPMALLLLMPLFGRAWVPLSVQLALLLVCIAFLIGRALSWKSFQLPLSTRQSLSQEPEHVEWAAQAKADRLEIAERLGAAIRLQTVSYDAADAKKDDEQAAADPDAAAAPSTDYAPFLAMHALLEEKYPLVHANLQRTVINNYSLLFHWKAAAAPAGSAAPRLPILLTAHLDVVPVPDAHLWDADAGSPFSGLILREEFVCGRGAIDDKHAVMGIMEAVESLLRRGFAPTRDVYVAFGHDEEVSGPAGAASIAAHLESLGLRFSFLLDEGLFVMDGMVPGVSSQVAMVCVAEKGFLVSEYKVSVPAHLAGHASTPARESAIGILARALTAMESAPMSTYLSRGSPVRLMFESVASHAALPHKILFANLNIFSPLLRWVLALKNTSATLIRTTTALTVIHAGTKANVVPREASALINHRIHPEDSVAGVLRYSAAVVNDARVRITDLSSIPPAPVSSHTSEGFRAIQSALGRVMPEVLVAPALMVGNTDTWHYARLCDDVYRFSPTRMNGSTISRFHGANERIAIDNYLEVIGFYRAVIQLADAPHGSA